MLLGLELIRKLVPNHCENTLEEGSRQGDGYRANAGILVRLKLIRGLGTDTIRVYF